MSYPFIRTTYGRRMGALALDWLACMSIVGAFSGGLFAVDPLETPLDLSIVFCTDVDSHRFARWNSWSSPLWNEGCAI